jgi:pimeloyl-ACP methyl ester carboxylesterase
MEAGKQLAAYIAVLKLEPSDRLFIVAHSHGGNVALYALRHPGTERVEGVIFLATPFVQFGLQNFPFAGFRMLPFAIRCLVTIFLGSLLLAPAARMVGKVAIPGGTLVLGGIILAVVFGVSYLIALRAERRVRKLLAAEPASDEIQQLCKYYQPQAPHRQRVLIFRKAGDEASAALESGRFVEFLTTRGWQLLSWLSGLPRASLTALSTLTERHPRPLGISIDAWKGWILLPLMIIVAYVFVRHPDIFGTVFGYGYVLYVSGFLLIICAVPAFFFVQMLLVAFILFCNVVRFGRGPTLFQTALLRVTSEVTPLGSWEVRTFAAIKDAHSEIHEDPEVARAIWDFLQKSVIDGRQQHEIERTTTVQQ